MRDQEIEGGHGVKGFRRIEDPMTSIKSQSPWGPPINGIRTLTTYLCNDSGWWIYDRWVSKPGNLDRAIDDILYGFDSGILEINEDTVITIVEEVT